MRAMSCWVRVSPRVPSPTHHSRIRSRPAWVPSGVPSASASRMISRRTSGPRSAWPLGRLARSASGKATAWPARSSRSRGQSGKVADRPDEVVLGVLGLLEGTPRELAVAEEPAIVAVAAWLAGLGLDHEEAIVGIDDDDVGLAVVRGPRGARLGEESDVRVEARARRQRCSELRLDEALCGFPQLGPPWAPVDRQSTIAGSRGHVRGVPGPVVPPWGRYPPSELVADEPDRGGDDEEQQAGGDVRVLAPPPVVSCAE